MKIEVYPDDDVVARKAAAVIAAAARAAVTSRGRFIMAVSGGHTPWSMLRALAADELPWQQVHVVQVDERVAPAADPDRNLAHLRASLLDRTPLPPDHIHAMPIETSRICAQACLIVRRCRPTTSTRCRSKPRTSIVQPSNTPARCETWQVPRQCSTSFISA